MHHRLAGPLRAAMLAVVAVCAGFVPADGGDTWPRRFGNAQNTTDAGVDVDENGVARLHPGNVADLALEAYYQIGGNATPIIGHGLAFYGATGGIYVLDLESGKTLIRKPIGGIGLETTGTLATVTVPEGVATREENRFYIGTNSAVDTLHCLSVDAILADRATIENDPGDGYLCDGPARPFEVTGSTGALTAAARLGETGPRGPWPLSLEPPPPGLGPGLGMILQSFHGTPLFRRDQPIRTGDAVEIRDVLFTPSMGIEPACSNSVVWAIDAYTGEKLWQWDPVVSGDGRGAVVWFSPAMSRDGKHLYLTTGDCVDKPHLGDKSESIVSLDPETGTLQWYRQTRVLDTRDFDIGNSPTVVDVEGQNGCHLVTHVDKDGCFYGFSQERDVPEVGEPGYDPLRPGQQRLLWRQCVARSGTTGGFDATGASFHGRWLLAQSQRPGGADEGDNAYGFAVDACTGEFLMASSDLASGYSDGAVANGMWFIPNKSNTKMQVLSASPPFELLATVPLPNVAPGGGGPAIAGGKVYVPAAGIAVFGVVPGSGRSLPQPGPPLVYHGPYDEPTGTSDVNVFGPPWPAADAWDDL